MISHDELILLLLSKIDSGYFEFLDQFQKCCQMDLGKGYCRNLFWTALVFTTFQLKIFLWTFYELWTFDISVNMTSVSLGGVKLFLYLCHILLNFSIIGGKLLKLFVISKKCTSFVKSVFDTMADFMSRTRIMICP